MKKFVVLLGLLLSACAPEFPKCEKDHVMIHGLCLNMPSDLSPEITKDVIEFVHDYEGLDIDNAAKEYKAAKVTINWQEDTLGSTEDGFFQYYNDYIEKRGVIVLRHDNSFCLNYRIFILIHESLHMAWWFDSNDADDDHKYLGLNLADAFDRQTEDFVIYQKYLVHCNTNGLFAPQ